MDSTTADDTLKSMTAYESILDREDNSKSTSSNHSFNSDVGANVSLSNESVSSSKSFFEHKSMLHHEDMDIPPNQREFFCFLLEKLETLEKDLQDEKLVNKVITNRINILEKKYVYQNKKLKNINIELAEIDDDLYNLDTKIIKNDQYSRRSNIVVSGIPESVGQDELEKTVLNILNTIGLHDVSSYQVAACHRLRKRKTGNYPSNTIIRFTNRKIVEYCISHRDRLRECRHTLGMNLRFYENLCDSNEFIVNQSTILLANGLIKSYKVKNGFVFITVEDARRPIKIKHPSELYDLFADYYNSTENG